MDRFRAIRDQDASLTTDDIPRVMTIDSSQGDEAFMVIFDTSAQHGDVVGKYLSTHSPSETLTKRCRPPERRLSFQRCGDPRKGSALDDWWEDGESHAP